MGHRAHEAGGQRRRQGPHMGGSRRGKYLFCIVPQTSQGRQSHCLPPSPHLPPWRSSGPGVTRGMGAKRQKEGLVVIPRSWFGGGERAGFHTCTQLEDLILALLPQDQVHKSHCSNSDGHLLAPVFPAGPAASDWTPGPAEPAKDAVGKAPGNPGSARSSAQHVGVILTQDPALLYSHQPVHKHRTRPW